MLAVLVILIPTGAGLCLLLAEAFLSAPVEAIWPRALLGLGIVAAAAGSLRHPRVRGPSRALVLPLQLALLAGIALPLTLRTPDESGWARRREAQLQHHYSEVRRNVLGLEAVVRDVGDRAYALLADSSWTMPLPPEQQIRLFDRLETLLRETPRGPGATAPSLSVRLFGAKEDLLAWAGELHSGEGALRLTHFAPGPRETYFRRSGALTFLTYDRQDARTDDVPPDGVHGIRVVVETPVQARHGTRPRLPAGANWSERLSGSGVDVDLLYEIRLVPPYLNQKDMEIHGDPQRGLQAEFVVRGDDGAPRLLGRLSTAPLADELLLQQRRVHRGQRVFALLALGFSLAIAMQRWRRTARRSLWERPQLLIAALWIFRCAAAAFDLPPSSLQGSPLLSPATFGIVGFWGLLRSPLDLFLTALTLLTSVVLLLGAQVLSSRKRQQASLHAWRLGAGLLLTTGLAAGTVLLTLRAVEVLARNASLPLMGPDFDWTAWPVVCLHGALLAGVAGILVLSLLGVSRLVPRGAPTWCVLAAAGLLTLFLWIRFTPLLALVGLGVLLGGFFLHTLLRDDRFTSFSLATFGVVALTATLCTAALQRDRTRTRQELVLARADSVRQLVDDVRSFVLEQVLRDLMPNVPWQGDPELGDNVVPGSFAFEIWAESMLSRMGWPCQIRVYNAYGPLLSEFSLGLPYPQDTQTREIRQRAQAAGISIEQTEIEGTPVGNVRLVRGAVPLRLGRTAQYPVVVVVDLPFGHESLALAANPRVRAPELLRPLGDLDTGPRVEESQLYLLAWLRHGVVVESSTPYLEVGAALGGTQPKSTGWRALHLLNGAYWVTEIPAGERTLLAGFRMSNPLDWLLDWTQVAALDFTIAVGLLFVFALFGRVPEVARALPPLFVPKRLGFQQKLMGAFLVVALLPSLVISLATRDIMRDRSTSRNRDAALAKARSAEAALSDVVRREIQTVRESEYLRAVVQEEEAPPVRDIGNLEFSQIMVFHGDGRLILDETLSNLSDEEARRFVTDSPRQVFASRDAGHLDLGVLEPIWLGIEGRRPDMAPEMRLYYLYYRRRLTDDLLRELAPILNTDISGFLGPQLVVSSQKSLAAAGLLPILVPPVAYTHVQLRDNRYAVVEEEAASQRYFSGYLPLEDRFGRRIATLAVQQLLQPDEFAVEVERTRALVVGLSTTMFVIALILAVVFAARIFDPVRNLIDGTRRIAGGDLGFRLRARAGDEIGELERSFNEMTLRLQAARAALEERRRYLEAVLGNIASGVVATDVEGHITAANAAAARILGASQERLAESNWKELAREAQDTGTRSFWSHVGEADEGDITELTMRRDDEPLTLRLIVTELRSIDGAAESLGRVAIFEDVTELIRSKKLAAWAEMARQVAHEIKNPLTPLKLSAQFMEQAYRDGSEHFPEIFTEGMRTIVQQVDVLRKIASEFSGFGRIQKLQRKPLELGGLLRRVIAPYRTMPGIALDLGDIPPDSFPGDGVTVLGDDEGLRKVFSNILENAREAMGGAGRIVLRVEAAGDGQVLVRVGDEGTGVSPEAQEKLFEPYFSTKTTGTGLGLAITRSILEELGGTITLSNRPRGGAEVRITLPSHGA